MSTTTFDDRLPAPSSTNPLRRFVAAHAVAIYFALAVAISWAAAALALGPASFPLTPERFEQLGGPMYAAFLTGPVLASLIVIGAGDGRRGHRELFARLRAWRVGWRAYGLALLPALVLAGVTLLVAVVSPNLVLLLTATEDKASLVLSGLALSVMVGFFEELGWTGLATPKLLRKHRIAATGLIIGIVWGAWHFPLFWTAESFRDPSARVLLALQLFAWLPGFRILMVDLYARTGSLIPPMLMHVGLVTTQLVLMPRSLTATGGVVHLAVWTATIWVLVAAFRWFGSHRPSGEDRHAAPEPRARPIRPLV